MTFFVSTNTVRQVIESPPELTSMPHDKKTTGTKRKVCGCIFFKRHRAHRKLSQERLRGHNNILPIWITIQSEHWGCASLYLHKVIDDSQRHNDCYKYRCGQTDHEEGTNHSQQTEDPGTEGHGDHFVHRVHILKEERVGWAEQSTESR